MSSRADKKLGLLSHRLSRLDIGDFGRVEHLVEDFSQTTSRKHDIFDVEKLKPNWEPKFHHFGRLLIELRLVIVSSGPYFYIQTLANFHQDICASTSSVATYSSKSPGARNKRCRIQC